jgi:hypothetical protein
MNRIPLTILVAGGLLAGLSGHSKIPGTASLPQPAKRKIILHGISSAGDRASIESDAMPVLDEAARILQQKGAATVIVAPCADCSNDPRSTATLARSVRGYLEQRGASLRGTRVQFLQPAS